MEGGVLLQNFRPTPLRVEVLHYNIEIWPKIAGTHTPHAPPPQHTLIRYPILYTPLPNGRSIRSNISFTLEGGSFTTRYYTIYSIGLTHLLLQVLHPGLEAFYLLVFPAQAGRGLLRAPPPRVQLLALHLPLLPQLGVRLLGTLGKGGMSKHGLKGDTGDSKQI